jgi:hypothetical protein
MIAVVIALIFALLYFLLLSLLNRPQFFLGNSFSGLVTFIISITSPDLATEVGKS